MHVSCAHRQTDTIRTDTDSYQFMFLQHSAGSHKVTSGIATLQLTSHDIMQHHMTHLSMLRDVAVQI